jgi:hypothetical protein
MTREPRSMDVPPVPLGLEHVLALAAAHEGFAQELLTRRSEALLASGVELTASERAMLQALPAATLAQMAEALRPRLAAPERRRFFERAAAALVVVGGGAVGAAGCGPKTPSPAPDRSGAGDGSLVPRERTRPDEPPAPTGIAPDRPEPRAVSPDASVAPQPRPRPEHPTSGTGSRPGTGLHGLGGSGGGADGR